MTSASKAPRQPRDLTPTEHDYALVHADELLALQNQLCFPLYAASKEVVRAYQPLLAPLGLTYTQYLVMMVLWGHDAGQGSVSVHELGERLYLDSGTLTPVLAKMDAAGLVSRNRSAADARVVDVTLTDKGRALRARAADVPLRLGSCVDLAPDEAAELKRLLLKVLAGLR